MPPLLQILRSRQQGEVLALLLGDPDLEMSLTHLAQRLGTPYPSVHPEIERAEAAGIVVSRKIGNTRLVRANVDSPYYAGLADVLTKAFGVPTVLAQALHPITGISEAYVYGSWAARHAGEEGNRPVGDIDVLVVGSPDRDELYAALQRAEEAAWSTGASDDPRRRLAHQGRGLVPRHSDESADGADPAERHAVR